METIRLTDEEIRTAMLFTDYYKRAQAQAAMAAEQQAEYIEQLRGKYKLGPEWELHDVLIGFERAVSQSEVADGDKND